QRANALLTECRSDLAVGQHHALHLVRRDLVVRQYLIQNAVIALGPLHHADGFAREMLHRLNRRMRWDNESNNVTPQDGDRLSSGAGEHIAAHDGEVDLAGRERLHPRFHVRHWHDLQAHAGMFFRQGAHEGGQEFLAVAAHWTSSNLYVYIG